MEKQIHIIEQQILELPADEREVLLVRLIHSLTPDPRVEALWDEEIERRANELDAHPDRVISMREAMALLRPI